MKLLLQIPLEVKKHCESLDDNGKQELYRQVLKEAKDATESNDVDQLKKLSEIAVAIEEVCDRELFEPFDDENPLRLANIVVERNSITNYLFSLSGSSKLYDLRENTEETLYEAVKSDDVELVKHLLIVLLPDSHKEMTGLDLNHLSGILSKAYKELEENISKDMKNYLEKKIRFYSFLYDFEINKDPVELFANQSEPDYEIDKFLLSLIVKKIKEEELLSEINSMIELLRKYERFDELDYKIRRLKSELKSGENKYSAKVIQDSIEEREKEMLEIEAKYIRLTDLMRERERLARQLVSVL